MVIELRNEEVSRRKVLEGFGLVADEKLPVTKGRRTKSQEEPNEYECEICRGNLFLSLVSTAKNTLCNFSTYKSFNKNLSQTLVTDENLI